MGGPRPSFAEERARFAVLEIQADALSVAFVGVKGEEWLECLPL